MFFHLIPERPIVHSPCPKSPLLRCSQITLPSFPLTHFSIVFFFPLLLLLSSHTVRSSQPSSFIHSYNLSSILRLLSARSICPVPRSTPVNPPCPRGSEAEWKLNAQSAVTTIDLYSPIYRRCEEVC